MKTFLTNMIVLINSIFVILCFAFGVSFLLSILVDKTFFMSHTSLLCSIGLVSGTLLYFVLLRSIHYYIHKK